MICVTLSAPCTCCRLSTKLQHRRLWLPDVTLNSDHDHLPRESKAVLHSKVWYMVVRSAMLLSAFNALRHSCIAVNGCAVFLEINSSTAFTCLQNVSPSIMFDISCLLVYLVLLCSQCLFPLSRVRIEVHPCHNPLRLQTRLPLSWNINTCARWTSHRHKISVRMFFITDNQKFCISYHRRASYSVSQAPLADNPSDLDSKSSFSTQHP